MHRVQHLILRLKPVSLSDGDWHRHQRRRLHLLHRHLAVGLSVGHLLKQRVKTMVNWNFAYTAKVAQCAPCNIPLRGCCGVGRLLTTLLSLLRAGCAGGNSEVASWMFIGRPSKGTPLYCFIALTASARLSNTTSAVPANRWRENWLENCGLANAVVNVGLTQVDLILLQSANTVS